MRPVHALPTPVLACSLTGGGSIAEPPSFSSMTPWVVCARCWSQLGLLRASEGLPEPQMPLRDKILPPESPKGVDKT